MRELELVDSHKKVRTTQHWLEPYPAPCTPYDNVRFYTNSLDCNVEFSEKTFLDMFGNSYNYLITFPLKFK